MNTYRVTVVLPGARLVVERRAASSGAALVEVLEAFGALPLRATVAPAGVRP